MANPETGGQKAKGSSKATNPSKWVNADQLTEVIGIKHKNKMDAMAEEFVVKEDGQWAKIGTYWTDADDNARKNIVFGLTYNNGAKPKDIARLFDVKVAELAQYASVMNQAVAALKLKIQGNQITSAFMTDLPVMKFFLGKQFAEQAENPVHEGVASIDESKEHQININVIGKDTDTAMVQGSDNVYTAGHVIQ